MKNCSRALEALPSAVMVVDAADTILTWNPAAETLFEISVGSALGRKFRDLDVSDRVAGLRARMEDVKARQAVARLQDITVTRRNGEVVSANVTIAPLFEAYRFIGVLVFVEDSTEYARLQEQMTRIAEQHATAIEELQSTNEELETTVEELQAANAELAALNAELEDRGADVIRLDGYHRGVVNSMEQGLLVIDRRGVVRTWNHSAERMWGLRSEQVVGREFFTLPLGELVQRTRPGFERMLESGQTQQVEGVPYQLPGGTERRVLLRIAPVKDGGGEIVGGLATAWPEDGRVVIAGASGDEVRRRPGRTRVVLVVDDHADTRDMYAQFLQAMGLETREASTCAEALALSARDGIDAIVLDRRLPDGDGVEVCRTLKADPRTRALPVIVLSGRAHDGTTGADAYLMKPVTPDQLLSELQRLLAQRAGGSK